MQSKKPCSVLVMNFKEDKVMNYKFRIWYTKLPDAEFTKCLLTLRQYNGSRSVVDGWVDRDRMSYSNAIAWMPFPEHVLVNRDGWRSIYLGDDEPKPAVYLLSLQKKSGYKYVSLQWYDPFKSKFSEGTEVLAWMPVPRFCTDK